MTNSDGGFQFDFQQPEKPVRPMVQFVLYVEQK